MKIWCTDSLKYIAADCDIPENPEMEMKIKAAGNTRNSYQIVLKNDKEFVIYGIEFENLYPAEMSYAYQEKIHFECGDFQDPLNDKSEKKVEKEKAQSIWITLYAKEVDEKTSLDGIVRILTSEGKYETRLKAEICAFSIPTGDKGAFSTEYWMNTVNFWFRYPDSKQADFIKERFGCEKYSEEWWKVNQSIAENMKENRINVLFVRTHDLLLDGGTQITVDGKYEFKWDLFDKWIDFFEKFGEIKYFAGYHLAVQTEGKQVYLLHRNTEGKMEITVAPIESSDGINWMDQFLPALYKHLDEKGIKDRWYQHIQDEPENEKSWNKVRATVRKYMPGIKCLDALDSQKAADKLKGLDVWIPRVDVYEKNKKFYDYRLGRGDMRWTYTCCEPHRHNYLNKMMGFPLLHNRLIGWGCFLQSFQGFLHWGYNFWDKNDIYFGLNEKNICKGDGYIVYPDRENLKVQNSIRMTATRDSAQDYELLTMLAEENPGKAYEIAEKAVSNFHDFEWDEDVFLEVYRELLEELEKIFG